MNIRTMKAIDQYAGIPLCLLLDLVSKLARLLPRHQRSESAQILVIKLFGMGSIIHASPMLRGLRSNFGNARISFLTFASNRDIVLRLGLLDDVLSLRTESFPVFAGDVFRAVSTIRQRGYDVAIDMEFFSKFSTIINYLSGSPIRIGYFLRQLWRGDLLTHQIYYNQHRHIGEVFAALAEPLGVQVSDFTLVAPLITEEELKSASSLLEAAGLHAGKMLVAVNVNASELAVERRWPPECFQQLISSMLEEGECHFVFIGSSNDVEYTTDVVKGIASEQHDRIINLAGQTGVGELLGLLSRCRLLISNDSGPLHLAVSLGVPTVSFFGPETPALYAPLGENHLSFYSGVYCSPCLNVFNAKTTRCNGDNVCMKALKVDAVIDGMRQRFPDLWQKVDGNA